MGKMEQEAPAKVMLPSQADSRSIEAQLKDSGRFKVKGDGKTLEGSSALDLSKSKGKLLVPMIQESDPSSRTEQIRVTYPA